MALLDRPSARAARTSTSRLVSGSTCGLVQTRRRGGDEIAIHIAEPARLGQRVGLGHDVELLGQLAPQPRPARGRTHKDYTHQDQGRRTWVARFGGGFVDVWLNPGGLSALLVCVAGPHPRETPWGPTPTAASASLRSAPVISSP